MKNKIGYVLLALIFSLGVVSCEKIDSNRIPYSPVNIELDNDGLWNTYGVHSIGENRQFVKSLKIPANYNYTALTYTGFGGVLLIGAPDNTPLAYDLCCPVEASSSVRVYVNGKLEAQCPKCGSRYDVLYLSGAPIDGLAVDRKLGLQRYHVRPASMGGYIIGR